MEVTVKLGDDKQIKALGGALVSPEKIQPALPRPDDFDAFWKDKLKELADVPMNAQVVAADGGRTNIDYFKITMDNIRGSHIHGQLARPREGEKLPAMLIVQWAGVYPLQKPWITQRASEGWLVLDINAHDLPIDESEQFYKDQAAGPLKDYPAIETTIARPATFCGCTSPASVAHNTSPNAPTGTGAPWSSLAAARGACSPSSPPPFIRKSRRSWPVSPLVRPQRSRRRSPAWLADVVLGDQGQGRSEGP